MKRLFAKISLFFLVLFFIFSCDAVKRLDENQQLLEKNEIFVNGDKISQANIIKTVTDETLYINYGERICNSIPKNA